MREMATDTTDSGVWALVSAYVAPGAWGVVGPPFQNNLQKTLLSILPQKPQRTSARHAWIHAERPFEHHARGITVLNAPAGLATMKRTGPSGPR